MYIDGLVEKNEDIVHPMSNLEHVGTREQSGRSLTLNVLDSLLQLETPSPLAMLLTRPELLRVVSNNPMMTASPTTILVRPASTY